MKLDSKDLDKFIADFKKWGNRDGVLKRHLWNAVSKCGGKGKEELLRNTPDIPNWYTRFLSGGNLGKGSYVIGLGAKKGISKSQFMETDSLKDLRVTVLNKKKVDRKLWTKPRLGKNYADRFVYKRFGDPIPKIEKAMKEDFERGIERAVNDSFERAFK